MIKICFRATWTWRLHNIVNVVNATEWYTLRRWILYYLNFTSVLIKGKTKEIIYYIHSGVTLPEGKEMDPVWVFSHFLLSQAVCSALGSGAFVPMVTNANWLQGAKGSTWGSEWSLKDRKKMCLFGGTVHKAAQQPGRVLPWQGPEDGLWSA